ncbi:MAG TPA: glycosyltransferase family 2 protein [Solirubrobacteraceae bacterium]
MIEVILPVLDEAAAIPVVLAAMPPGFEPLVVDNGSIDGSGRVARDLGARVIFEPRRGFGAACYAGLCAARRELVCFMDCDGSLDANELSAVVEPVASGALDLCLGARLAQPGAWPVHARLANRVLGFELRRRAGVKLSDLGPMRCAGRERLLSLELRDRACGWPLEMVLKAAQRGWRVGEVGVSYRARAAGRSKVTGSLSGTARALRDMGAVLAETA